MKNMTKFFMAFYLLVFAFFSLPAQDRGLAVVAKEYLGPSVNIGKQWAVFIAIDRYQEWGPLTNPVRDAKEIRDILQEFYYIDEVRELYDREATAAGIRQLLVNLRSQVGANDSVFVFYAGHGYTDPNTNTGFWIPSDAGQDQMRQSNWLPNIQVRSMLSMLNAMHVFLISDACFSGDILNLTRGSGPVIDNEYFRSAYSKVSRQVMTSGSSEEVDDFSEFAMRLKSALRRNESACIDPHSLFAIVREVQHAQPLLGSIPGSEHRDGGTFLFFRKQAATNVPPPSDTAEAHFDKGRLFREREDWDTAILEYTEAIRLDPSYSDAYLGRGIVYYYKKDYDRAITDYTQAIRLDPNYAVAYCNRGAAYDRKGDNDLAIADYTQSIRLDPNYAVAYYNRGQVYYDKKDNDRAIADYTHAIRIDPNYADAYYNRGTAYYYKKDYDLAIADYTQAIRIDPNYAFAYNNRGVTYKDKKDYDRAIADYEAALRIDPNYSLTKSNLEEARRLKAEQ